MAVFDSNALYVYSGLSPVATPLPYPPQLLEKIQAAGQKKEQQAMRRLVLKREDGNMTARSYAYKSLATLVNSSLANGYM